MHPAYDESLGDARRDFLETRAPKLLLAGNLALAGLYFAILAFVFPIGEPILFYLLIAGEIFHLSQVAGFIYTVWDTRFTPVSLAASYAGRALPAVDVFITVAGEPAELVRRTIQAAKTMRYPAFSVFVLNDGYVAKKANWREIEALASKLGVDCITRTIPGGAKAGNINNALRFTTAPLIACFDADHAPAADFLEKTVAYFADETVAFVQTPQFYRNADVNYVTKGAWEQQELFFGPIMKGKNRLNAVPMCGTNMVIRRAALAAVGGVATDSITEDLVTGLRMHAAGYRSVYVPEVLAEGLAPEDVLTYSKQQFRWARGTLDLIFRYNPLFMRGLSWAQRIQYLASASFYLSGLVIALDAALPLLYFYFGIVPVHVDGMLLAAVFLPYFFYTLFAIQSVSNFTYTFSSLGFSMGSFAIQIRAVLGAATRRRAAFAITEKRRQRGNFLFLAKWHLAYVALFAAGLAVALLREGLSASLLNNAAWALLNTAVFLPFIRAALPERADASAPPARERERAPERYGIHHRPA
ncbi:MAG: glycosyltransferase [Patescibacteria group bacterium]|nr:glycosyltransferase [Patescibacteria group bacterium]MDE1944978.1 glycosyltransferase [Patescibacteria group bacterium]MDE2057401.1 glycosyltransferase [Patescibacteria group bacterium]